MDHAWVLWSGLDSGEENPGKAGQLADVVAKGASVGANHPDTS